MKIKKTNPHFSSEQLDAIQSWGSDLKVVAGAGSGKTTLLVRRFLHGVRSGGIGPNEILAITFTEKAAHQMKERLVRECGDDVELRRRLEEAEISTIHSFCSKLLKEYPIESGVDPFFSVLAEGESDILADKVLDRLFEREAANERWISILSDYGDRGVRSVLKRLYAMERSSAGETDPLRVPDFSGERANLEDEIARSASALFSEIPDSAEGGALKIKTAAGRLVSTLGSSGELWPKIHGLLAEARQFERRGKLKERAGELRDRIEEWARMALAEAGAPVKTELIRVFRMFRAEFDAEKRKACVYDFEDLLQLAFRLLSGQGAPQKAVRERLRQKFSAILLDEFQDTTPLEMKIIELLKRPGNLFIVGDAQQSIYHFRLPEPASSSQPIHSEARQIVLSENYRSRADILVFVNRFFAGFPGEFLTLNARRDFTPKKEPCIECLCVGIDGKGVKDLAASRIVEARSLARRIRELVDSGAKIEPGPGFERTIRYGDIAILLRNGTYSAFYESELERAGIPFFLEKGRGFFDRPEVLDILCFLRILEDPRDDIALAAVLRSPFFNLSDDALFLMAHRAKAEDSALPLWSGVADDQTGARLAPADQETRRVFLETYRALQSKRSHFGVAEMIRKAVNATGYLVRIAAGPEGRQKWANVVKLMDLAAVSSGSRTGLETRDFLRIVEKLRERETSEAQAKTARDRTEAVTISTIHSAKGLEFPCVILANLGGKESAAQRDFLIASSKEGLGLKVFSPLTHEAYPDEAHHRLSEACEASEEAEEIRLYYVAMTRAQERLIFSGGLPIENGSRKKSSSWFARILDAAGIDPTAANGRDLAFGEIPVRVLQSSDQPIPKREELRCLGAYLSICEGQPTLDLKDVPSEESALERLRQRLDLPVKPYDWTQDLTVTDLMPDARPVFSDEEEDADDEEDNEMPRNEFGTIFHRVMELCLPKGLIRPGERFVRNLVEGLSGSQQKELLESASLFWKGELGREIRQSRHRYSELPFIYKTNRGMLKGQIDLVFKNSAGKWIILDYKTNRIVPEQKAETAAHYEAQLQMYALIFFKLYGEYPEKGILYFSSIAQTAEFCFQAKDFEAFEEVLEKRFEEISAQLIKRS